MSTALAVGVAVVAAALAAARTPGYSSVEETVSQLMNAGAPAGVLARGGIVLYSVLLVPLAVAVGREFPAKGVVRWVAAAGLWAHIIAGVNAGAFANDAAQVVAGGVTVNDVHDAAGYAMYAAAMVATGAVMLALGPGWFQPVSVLSMAVLAIMFACGIGLALNLAPGFAGLQERVGLGAFLAWLLVASSMTETRKTT